MAQQLYILPDGSGWLVDVLKDPSSDAKKARCLMGFPVEVPRAAWVSDALDPSGVLLAFSVDCPQRTAVAEVDRTAADSPTVAVLNPETLTPEKPLYSAVSAFLWKGANGSPKHRATVRQHLDSITEHLVRQWGVRVS
jgi:hypothetical protein